MKSHLPSWGSIGLVWMATVVALPGSDRTDRDLLPWYLRDRDNGVTTSQLGTYVRPGQFLLQSSIAHARTSAYEYRGEELGYTGDLEHFGEFTEQELLLFFAYGLTADLAVEVEVGPWARSTLRRADDDTTTGLPDRLKESGRGGLETQLRWRFAHETRRVPEWFCHLEVGIPWQSESRLRGNSEWEVGVGLGVVKGFAWGTLTARVAVDFDSDDGAASAGEYALEYHKRMSESWSMAAALEGDGSRLSAIGEVKWRFHRNAWARFNLGAGLTRSAPAMAPELGLLFAF